MIELDVDDILKKFNELDSKNQKKAYKQALRRATGILIRAARSNLKSAINVTGQASKRKQFKGKNLLRGIMVKFSKDNTSAKVNILSDKRLVWFELGTEVRSTKQHIGRKGHETGEISATNFFTKARTETESQVFSELETILMTSIQRTWDRNNK